MSGEEKRRGFQPENFREVPAVFSEKVPGLLDRLTDAVCGGEASARSGAAIANFYTRLQDSGLSAEQAFKLTEQYMSPLNLAGTIASAFARHGEAGE